MVINPAGNPAFTGGDESCILTLLLLELEGGLTKISTKIKILESIRGEKEVQENLTFAYDSVETEKKNKEVLEYQLVTTS